MFVRRTPTLYKTTNGVELNVDFSYNVNIDRSEPWVILLRLWEGEPLGFLSSGKNRAHLGDKWRKQTDMIIISIPDGLTYINLHKKTETHVFNCLHESLDLVFWLCRERSFLKKNKPLHHLLKLLGWHRSTLRKRPWCYLHMSPLDLCSRLMKNLPACLFHRTWLKVCWNWFQFWDTGWGWGWGMRVGGGWGPGGTHETE